MSVGVLTELVFGVLQRFKRGVKVSLGVDAENHFSQPGAEVAESLFPCPCADDRVLRVLPGLRAELDGVGQVLSAALSSSSSRSD